MLCDGTDATGRWKRGRVDPTGSRRRPPPPDVLHAVVVAVQPHGRVVPFEQRLDVRVHVLRRPVFAHRPDRVVPADDEVP